MPEDEKVQKNFLQRNIASMVLIVLAFLIGLFLTGWQWWGSSSELKTVRNELSETTKSLKKEEIKGFLTSAVTESQRQQFGLALKDTSTFFTRLRDDIDKGDESSYSKEEQQKLRLIFNSRDTIVASLATKDSSSVKRLIILYLNYLNATGNSRDSVAIEDTQKPEDQNANANANVNTAQPDANSNSNSEPELNSSEAEAPLATPSSSPKTGNRPDAEPTQKPDNN